MRSFSIIPTFLLSHSLATGIHDTYMSTTYTSDISSPMPPLLMTAYLSITLSIKLFSINIGLNVASSP